MTTLLKKEDERQSKLKAMSGVPSESVRSMCRVCLARGEHVRRIDVDLREEGSLLKFSEFFTALTTIGVLQDEKLPNRICQSCTARVLEAYEVRQLAQTSDSILRFIANHPEHPKSESVKSDINENILQVTHIKENPKRYVCSICSKSFPYKSELQRHKETHAPSYRCATCGKVFGFKSSLRRHERQHGRAGRVPCPHCSSLFKDEQLLKRHVQYAHQGKKYTCCECGAECGSASALRSHAQSHIASEERALRCGHVGCDKTFNFQHQLRRHEATHTGHKMFYCDNCGKGFVQAHHLISHMVKHRPEKRIPCLEPNCGKTFPTKYALKKHGIVHESRTYSCKKCSKIFFSSRSLRAHMQHCRSSLNKVTITTADNENAESTTCDSHGESCSFECEKNAQKSDHKSSLGRTEDEAKISANTAPVVFLNNNDTKETLSDIIMLREFESSSTHHINVDTTARQYHINNNSQNIEMSIAQSTSEHVQHKEYQVKAEQHESKSKNNSICHVTSNCSVGTSIEDVLQSGNCSDCCGNLDGCSRSDSTQTVSSTVKLTEPQVAHSLNNTQNKTSTMDMQGNDCNGFLGKCIVGNGPSEECICAKVKYEVPVPEYLTTPLLVALEQQGYYPN